LQSFEDLEIRIEKEGCQGLKRRISLSTVGAFKPKKSFDKLTKRYYF